MKRLQGEDLIRQLQVYVVTDERNDGEELLPIIEQAIKGGATAIQLRRKAALGRRFVQIGREIRALTRRHGVLFFVNDRVDVAAAVDADGVHVGQEDMSCKDARKILGDRLIGVSAETVEQAIVAERDGADYLGVGAVFPTISKPDAVYTGLEGLRNIAAAVHIPVVAIGGIGMSNVIQTLEHGAIGAAVVSAVMSASNPRQATRDLAARIHSYTARV